MIEVPFDWDPEVLEIAVEFLDRAWEHLKRSPFDPTSRPLAKFEEVPVLETCKVPVPRLRPGEETTVACPCGQFIVTFVRPGGG